MSFFVTCKHCGLRLEGAERLVGKVGICPGCKHAVVVERPPEDTAPQIIPMEIQVPPQDEPQSPQKTTQHKPQGTTAQPEGTTMPPPGRRFCSNCGAELENKANFCPRCGKSINNQGSNNPNIREKVCDTVNKGLLSNALGIEKLQGFSLSELLKDIFKKHSDEDVCDIIACGTPKTTPNITDIDTSWPRPWLFFRLLAYSLILYMGLSLVFHYYRSVFLIPSVMIIGSFAIPIAVLSFFIEVNVRRNIPITYIIKYFFLGGCLSIVVTLFLTKLVANTQLNVLTKSFVFAGLFEEPAKLLALYPFFINKKYRYKLNGLLLGAVVGAGFEVFESLGYAYDTLSSVESYATFVKLLSNAGIDLSEIGIDLSEIATKIDPVDSMQTLIVERGVESLAVSHIIWSAIAACALWRVLGKDDFNLSAFFDWRFLRLFLCPVILHCFWNANFELPYYGKEIIIGLVGWIVVLTLVQEGLKELREEKKKAENSQKMSDAGTIPDSAHQS